MEEDKKKFVEDVSKSEYFDFLLEKQIQNKLNSYVKKYKWIGGVALAAIIIIGSFLGIEVRNLEKQRAEITSQFASFRQNMNTLQTDIESKRADIEKLRDFFNMFKEINDRYTKFYEDKYTDYDTRIQGYISDMQGLTEKTRNFRDETRSDLDSMSGKISLSESNLTSALQNWDKERREVIKTSSTVYAYVERGNETEPGSEEYRPEFIDLPFSDKTMRVTFNVQRKSKEKNAVSGEDEFVKEAKLYITIYDEHMKPIRKDPYWVQEKRPINLIQGTNHSLEAQFIYLPPNPLFQSVPDFVILAVSLRPDAYQTMMQETGEIAQ